MRVLSLVGGRLLSPQEHGRRVELGFWRPRISCPFLRIYMRLTKSVAPPALDEEAGPALFSRSLAAVYRRIEGPLSRLFCVRREGEEGPHGKSGGRKPNSSTMC